MKFAYITLAILSLVGGLLGLGLACLINTSPRGAVVVGEAHVSPIGAIPGTIIHNDPMSTPYVLPPYKVQKIDPPPVKIYTLPELDNGTVFHPGNPDQLTVCVDKLAVQNNPGKNFPALSYLHRGDTVTVLERSKGVLGYAMIDVALWVDESGLCR